MGNKYHSHPLVIFNHPVGQIDNIYVWLLVGHSDPCPQLPTFDLNLVHQALIESLIPFTQQWLSAVKPPPGQLNLFTQHLWVCGAVVLSLPPSLTVLIHVWIVLRIDVSVSWVWKAWGYHEILVGVFVVRWRLLYDDNGSVMMYHGESISQLAAPPGRPWSMWCCVWGPGEKEECKSHHCQWDLLPTLSVVCVLWMEKAVGPVPGKIMQLEQKIRHKFLVSPVAIRNETKTKLLWVLEMSNNRLGMHVFNLCLGCE